MRIRAGDYIHKYKSDKLKVRLIITNIFFHDLYLNLFRVFRYTYMDVFLNHRRID